MNTTEKSITFTIFRHTKVLNIRILQTTSVKIMKAPMHIMKVINETSITLLFTLTVMSKFDIL